MLLVACSPVETTTTTQLRTVTKEVRVVKPACKEAVNRMAHLLNVTTRGWNEHAEGDIIAAMDTLDEARAYYPETKQAIRACIGKDVTL